MKSTGKRGRSITGLHFVQPKTACAGSDHEGDHTGRFSGSDRPSDAAAYDRCDRHWCIWRYFYSLDDVYSLMDEALVSRIAEYHEKLPLLHAFINMMNSQSIEAEESTAEGALSTVSLQNVSFTYPNAQQAALQDISFTIHKTTKLQLWDTTAVAKVHWRKFCSACISRQRAPLL